jgi:alkylation response protein AidB-like acyl-CoA dehydrogenase
MDLSYSEKYAKFRDEVRAFISQHGHSAPLPLGGRAPGFDDLEWQRRLVEAGFVGRTVPKEYGGFGAIPDVMEKRIIGEEFSRAGVNQGLTNQGVLMLVPTLLAHGSEEQKQRWIRPSLLGQTLWCQGYSEPGAGSDLASLQTLAVEDGEDFIINGQKIWTSSAHFADMIFCLVRTEPDQPKHLGISYLIFPMNLPGIDVRPLKTMTGEAEFNEVFFTDVRVPKCEVVGQRGQGWIVANSTLKHERGSFGDPGMLAARYKRLEQLFEREAVSGRRLRDDPVLVDRLMQLQGQTLALQFNAMRVMTCDANEEDPGLAALITKLQACELTHQIQALGIDALGEIGLCYGEGEHVREEGFWQGRYMLDLGLIIGGGTEQIQRNIIAERGLGMPREPKLAGR